MKRLISALILVLLLVAVASPAYAQGNGRAGLVAFGRDIVVQAGETINGDVVAFGGNVTVQTNTQVNGNVVAFGGDVRSAGEVARSVVAFGGNVNLESGSLVREDVVTLGGTVVQASGARVQGNVSRGFVFDLGDGPEYTPPLPVQPRTQIFTRPWAGDLALSIIVGFVSGVIKLAVLVALAVVLVAIFPRQIAGVKTTMTMQPGASTGVGCLTYLAAVALTIPLLLTCIGNFLMWPVLIIATTFGLGALGQIVGERLTGSSATQLRSPAFNAALGTALIIAGLLVADAIPFVGCFSWVFWLLVASLTTGAVVLSKFGTEVPALAPVGMPAPAAATEPQFTAPAAAGPVTAAPPSGAPVAPGAEADTQATTEPPAAPVDGSTEAGQ